jgi:hypothetical protein
MKLLLFTLPLVLLTGCEYIQPEKHKALQQQLAETQEKLQQAQQTLRIAETHRYQTFQQKPLSSYTWRLDTTTGRACLLLAPEHAWKELTTMQGSCAYEDANIERKVALLKIYQKDTQ